MRVERVAQRILTFGLVLSLVLFMCSLISFLAGLTGYTEKISFIAAVVLVLTPLAMVFSVILCLAGKRDKAGFVIALLVLLVMLTSILMGLGH